MKATLSLCWGFDSETVLKMAPVHPSEAGSRYFLGSETGLWPEGSLRFLGPSVGTHGHVTFKDVTKADRSDIGYTLTFVMPLAIRAISVGWYTQLRT